MEQVIKKVFSLYLRNSNATVGFVANGMLQFAKIVKKTLLFPQKVYENWIAKFIATRLYFLYWPLYKILDSLNVRFLINISAGVGHTSIEFDYFFRRHLLGQIDRSKKYVIILRNSYYYRDFLSLYKKQEWFRNAISFVSTSTFLYDLLLPLMMRFDRLIIDAGLARIKYHYPPADFQGNYTRNRPYVFQYHPRSGITQIRNYYATRLKTPSYFPLSDISTSPRSLLDKLGVKGTKKICLVHIKSNVMNATALITDPKTYLEALKFFSDLGYLFIFVGREKMPNEFAQFGMINYSESKYTSFKNDFLIFKACDLAIVGGSGISCLADCLDKPYLYLNHWHLAHCSFSRHSIFIPSLVAKKEGAFLDFSQQFQLYLDTVTEEEVFDSERYTARNATGDEIFQAAKELVELCSSSPPLTQLQEKYKKIDNGIGWLSVALSRPSHFFLEKHQHLFGDKL